MQGLASLRARPDLVDRAPAFRLELAAGWSSLLIDPDVGEGYGGGFFAAWGIHRRLGVELSVFFSSNPFEGALGKVGYRFLAGNVTMGPIIQLTRPGSRFMVTVDLALGAYLIVPVLQDSRWTLGFSGGLTIGYRIARWFGLGLKWRYHLFNVARLAGPEDYYDVKSLQKVGVIDRMELPGYLAFYF